MRPGLHRSHVPPGVCWGWRVKIWTAFFWMTRGLRNCLCAARREGTFTDRGSHGGIRWAGRRLASRQRLGRGAHHADAGDSVVDARGASLSLAAQVKGFLDFVPDGRIQGVIFNRMNPMMGRRMAPELEKWVSGCSAACRRGTCSGWRTATWASPSPTGRARRNCGRRSPPWGGGWRIRSIWTGFWSWLRLRRS